MAFNDLIVLIGGLRVPRTVLALLTGVALGGAGALIQGHTRNPLADPHILGINAGAALAVVIAVYAGVGTEPGNWCFPLSSVAPSPLDWFFLSHRLGRWP